MLTTGKRKVAAILALSILAISAFAISPSASAQTTESLIGIRGVGIAVDVSEKEPYRAKFGLLLSVEGESSTLTVKKGLIVINDEGSPIRYKVLPETWQVTAADGGTKFNAEGQVQDKDGNTFHVVLHGERFRETTRGNIYTVEGTFSGNGESYDLVFLAQQKALTPPS